MCKYFTFFFLAWSITGFCMAESGSALADEVSVSSQIGELNKKVQELQNLKADISESIVALQKLRDRVEASLFENSQETELDLHIQRTINLVKEVGNNNAVGGLHAKYLELMIELIKATRPQTHGAFDVWSRTISQYYEGVDYSGFVDLDPAPLISGISGLTQSVVQVLQNARNSELQKQSTSGLTNAFITYLDSLKDRILDKQEKDNLSELRNKLTSLMAEPKKKIYLVGAAYGDTRIISKFKFGELNPGKFAGDQRYCNALPALLSACQRRKDCALKPSSESWDTYLCGTNPVPLSKPKYIGLLIQYHCIENSAEELWQGTASSAFGKPIPGEPNYSAVYSSEASSFSCGSPTGG